MDEGSRQDVCNWGGRRSLDLGLFHSTLAQALRLSFAKRRSQPSARSRNFSSKAAPNRPDASIGPPHSASISDSNCRIAALTSRSCAAKGFSKKACSKALSPAPLPSGQAGVRIVSRRVGPPCRTESDSKSTATPPSHAESPLHHLFPNALKAGFSHGFHEFHRSTGACGRARAISVVFTSPGSDREPQPANSIEAMIAIFLIQIDFHAPLTSATGALAARQILDRPPRRGATADGWVAARTLLRRLPNPTFQEHMMRYTRSALGSLFQ